MFQVVEPLLPHMLGAYCDKAVKLRYDEEGGSFPNSPVADEEFIDLEVICVDGEKAKGRGKRRDETCPHTC